MPGSHGSITKAGKVRSQTPKVQAKERRTPIPRIRNRKNYYRRVLGANNQSVSGRRRRR
ncbi:MAG: 30S ribosomal protein S30e [Candidatus Ranarchaeia archaeon]